MNWITHYVRPKINSILGRRETPENLWIKDPESGELVFHKDLEDNHFVVPGSGHHMRIPVKERLNRFFDDAAYTMLAAPTVASDPLKFRDEKKYSDRLKDYRTRTGQDDSICNAVGKIDGLDFVFRVWRRPDAGRHLIADAIAAHHGCG
jgi:acetyl-CoA carboxylase carboxyl transferase subunit beta